MTALSADLKETLQEIDRQAPKTSEKAYRQYVSACILTHPDLARITAPEVDKRDPQKASINGYLGARIRTHFRQYKKTKPDTSGNHHGTKLERFVEKYCSRFGRTFVVTDAAEDLDVSPAAILRYLHLLREQGYDFGKISAGVYKLEAIPAPKPSSEPIVTPSGPQARCVPMVQPPLPLPVDTAAIARQVVELPEFRAMLVLAVKSAVIEQLAKCVITSTLEAKS